MHTTVLSSLALPIEAKLTGTAQLNWLQERRQPPAANAKSTMCYVAQKLGKILSNRKSPTWTVVEGSSTDQNHILIASHQQPMQFVDTKPTHRIPCHRHHDQADLCYTATPITTAAPLHRKMMAICIDDPKAGDDSMKTWYQRRRNFWFLSSWRGYTTTS